MSDFTGPRPEITRSASPRIGDDERNATINALTDHVAAGRLGPEEFDERADLALRARTQAQLDVLTADLDATRLVRRPSTAPVITLTPADLAKIVGVVAALGVLSFMLGGYFGYRGAGWTSISLWVASCVGILLGALLRGPRRPH